MKAHEAEMRAHDEEMRRHQEQMRKEHALHKAAGPALMHPPEYPGAGPAHMHPGLAHGPQYFIPGQSVDTRLRPFGL